MSEPLTEELLDQLLDSPDPAGFCEEHGIGSRTLSEYLNQLLDEKGLKRVDVVHEAGLDATFGYQIFKGTRKASRDKLLQIIFAMGCTLREANRVLCAGGLSQLYCKDRRDAIIIFCLVHGAGLHETDEQLYKFGERTIA